MRLVRWQRLKLGWHRHSCLCRTDLCRTDLCHTDLCRTDRNVGATL